MGPGKRDGTAEKGFVNEKLQLIGYTRILAPADFSGAYFTRADFQKIAQISSLCDFHYISEEIPSLMRFWFLWIFERPKKNAPTKNRVNFEFPVKLCVCLKVTEVLTWQSINVLETHLKSSNHGSPHPLL